MCAVRDFKFGVQIDRRSYKPKDTKVGRKGHDLRDVTYFYYFGPLLQLSNE